MLIYLERVDLNLLTLTCIYFLWRHHSFKEEWSACSQETMSCLVRDILARTLLSLQLKNMAVIVCSSDHIWCNPRLSSFHVYEKRNMRSSSKHICIFFNLYINFGAAKRGIISCTVYQYMQLDILSAVDLWLIFILNYKKKKEIAIWLFIFLLILCWKYTLISSLGAEGKKENEVTWMY